MQRMVPPKLGEGGGAINEWCEEAIYIRVD
jgi:hypothetical protein